MDLPPPSLPLPLHSAPQRCHATAYGGLGSSGVPHGSAGRVPLARRPHPTHHPPGMVTVRPPVTVVILIVDFDFEELQ